MVRSSSPARPRIVQRYFLREVLSPTLIALLVYTFLLLMNAFFLVAEYAHRFAVPLAGMGKLFLLQVPHVVVLTLPMALLLGILVASARLAADSELVALAAGGLSLRSLLRPVLGLAACFTLLTGWLAFELMPRANAEITRTLVEVFQQNVLRNLKPGEFNARLLPGFTLYVRDIEADAHGDLWRGVLFHQAQEDSRSNEAIFAREARPQIDRDGAALVLRLQGVTMMTLSPAGSGYDLRAFDGLLRRIEVPSLRRNEEKAESRSVRDATLPELLARLPAEGETSPFLARLVRVEVHKRFAIPAACLVFAFLGLGLGAGARRSGRAFAFVASLAVFLVYQQLFLSGERMATAGMIPPWSAMWTGNLLFGAIGLLVYHDRAREGRWLAALRVRLSGPLRQRWRTLAERVRAWRERRASLPVLGRAARHFAVVGLLDRYVLGRFLMVFAFVLLSCLLLYYSVTLTQLIEDISKNQIPLGTVVDLYVAWTPEMLTYILPITVLVSTIVCFSLLTRTNEVTAMLVHGVSRYRVVAPIVAFGVALTVVALPLYAWLPRAVERYDRIYAIVANKARDAGQIRVGWARETGGGRFFHFSQFDPVRGMLYILSAVEVDAASFAPRRHLFALRAVWEGQELKLEDGWERTMGAPGAMGYRSFARAAMPFRESRRDFGREWRNARHMTAGELDQYIAYRRAQGLDVRAFQVERENKRAFPFTSLVMMLLGLPFAFAIGKRGSLYGVGIAIAIGALFWCSVVVASYLGKLGVLPPALAAWSPNLVFAFQGIAGFLSLRT